MSAPGRSPAAPGTGRLRGVDATRGVALVGMMAVHVLPVTDAAGRVTLPHEVAGGRAAATFAVLAGVGLALAIGRDRPPRGRALAGAGAATAVRGLLIGLVGLLVAIPESPVAVVLAYYAALFLLAPALLGLRAPALAAVALVTALLWPVASHLVRPALPERSSGNPTLLRLLDAPGDVVTELLVTGYYPALAWVAYLAAGLAVGRLPLGRLRVQMALLVGGAALAVAATAVSALLLGPLGGRERLLAATPGLDPAALDRALAGGTSGTTPTTTWWWLAVEAPHSSTPPDLLATTGTALALLGALLLVARAAGALLAPLAAAGGMTLTLYSAHVLLVASDRLPDDPETSWLLQVAAALALAPAWRAAVGRGPLEEVVARAAAPVRRAVAGADGPQEPAAGRSGAGAG